MWYLEDCTVLSHMCAEDVFTEEQILKIITSGFDGETQQAKIYGPTDTDRPHIVDTEIRNTITRSIEPKQENHWIYQAITTVIDQINKRAYNYDIVKFDGLSMLEYQGSEQAHYNIHTDSAYDINESFALRKLSFIMQLSDPSEYEGGDTILYPYADRNRKIIIPKKRGTITVFPSIIAHEVTPVTEGNRLSLVTWVYGPKFR